MTINEKSTENINSSMLTKPKKIDKLHDQKIAEILKERKFFKTKILKENIEKTSTSLTNKNAGNKYSKLYFK